mgnify:CR=1 FL=1
MSTSIDNGVNVQALLDARDQSSRVTEQLQGILEATADGVVGVDQDGLITFMNPAAAALLNLDPVRALGLSSHALYHHSSAGAVPRSGCPARSCGGRTGRRSPSTTARSRCAGTGRGPSSPSTTCRSGCATANDWPAWRASRARSWTRCSP